MSPRAERRLNRTLSERASKALLAEFGVPLAPERHVRDADAAVAAAEDLGFPVVVKLNGDGITHKTERGLVRLAVSDTAVGSRGVGGLLSRARPGRW